jgi:Uncharacterized conserved protein
MTKVPGAEIKALSPREIRVLVRKNKWKKPTAGMALGYAQANLVVLPEKYAFHFLLFCQRNPKPCPLLEVLEPGRYRTSFLAKGADVRTDIPRYNVYRKGILTDTVEDIRSFWRDDFVSFFLGCSFSFEEAMLKADIPVRHLDEGKNVPMYITNIACQPAGIFEGPMVVTMRPLPPEKVVSAVTVTSRYRAVHGGPIHIGDPGLIGIGDLTKPDYGDAVTVRDGEIPAFWACGVTPQAVVMTARPEICITHAPGYMFVTDVLNENLAH